MDKKVEITITGCYNTTLQNYCLIQENPIVTVSAIEIADDF